MKNLGIKWRIILPVGIALCLGISAITIIIAIAFSRAMTDSVNHTLQETAGHYATQIEADMVSALGGVRVLSTVLKEASGTLRADRAYYIDVMGKVVTENKELFGIWACFEPNTFDGKDAQYAVNGDSSGDGIEDKLTFAHDQTGRYVPYSYIAESGSAATEPLTDYDTPGPGDYYLGAKNSRHETISSTYYYQAGGQSYYIASVTVPIIKDNQVVGAAGGDIDMGPISHTLENIKLFDNGYLMVLDDKGFFAYTKEQSDWGQDAKGKLSAAAYSDVLEVSKSGQPKLVNAVVPGTGQRVIAALAPIPIGNTKQAWVVRAVIPYDEAMAPVKRGLTLTIITGASILLISLIMLYWQMSTVARILSALSSRLFNASSSVNQAAGNISEASDTLAEGSTEQAASLEETSAALEQMSSMTKQNAANASKTNEVTKHTAELVQVCSGDMNRMSDAMADINDKSERISRIIKTIEDITFQTNLLALNAAVEAARAGEAGKGFAVVADEVRNLSQRSAQAAKDTTELIGGTVESVRHGSEIVGHLAESFREIETGTTNSARLIAEITSATQEQAQGVGQVNIAVTQMDKVTQQNAASAEETASVTKELSIQADELEQMVEELAILVNGHR
ncbi:MAG: methyl-accepting chemotaxis protein [Deltaproteobacteria bacterium]|jgi:methyl-accepting chemotaxis protein|nr:methyl-accepting chemotaxis protein [Deltaproteobacteria bacterium]